MRLLPALILITLSACGKGASFTADTPAPFPAQPRFLVAGQSNAVSPAQSHPNHYSSTGTVWINDYYNGNAIRVPTQAEPMSGGISWIYLGDMMNRPVTFYNVARGGRSSRRWRYEYLPLILEALSRDHYDAILWVQGESDVVEKISGEETYENMRAIIEASRAVQPGIEWYVAVDSLKTGSASDCPHS
jgi:hypothetical protein